MRLLRRLAALAGVVLALILLGASQAVAGGPTSVLVVSPESGQSSSLYYTAARYRQLEKYLGSADVSGVARRPLEIDGAVEQGGAWRRITVSWLVHDVSVWRVDRVHLPKSNGAPIWVSTRTDGPAGPEERWHPADDPVKLRGLLGALGVLGDSEDTSAAGAGTGGGGDYPPDFADRHEAEGPDAESGAATPLRSGDSAGSAAWWWAIPGLAAGVLIGFTGVTLVRRGTARRDPGPQGPGRPRPRRQLIDS